MKWNEDSRSFARGVRYTRDYPKLDINAPSDKRLRTLLLTKSELWKDEEEWRCVVLEGGPAQWSISQKALKAVIFGTRASADLRATIAHLIAAHKPWVELREIVEVPFSYDLQVRPLPIQLSGSSGGSESWPAGSAEARESSPDSVASDNWPVSAPASDN